VIRALSGCLSGVPITTAARNHGGKEDCQMKRILTGVLASAFLALALPAAASAHHRARHDARGARAHHHRRHHHTVVFAPSARPSSTPGSETAPTTEEPVATVASFEGGILKITLPDGSTASGKVTEETWISCGCDHHFDGPPSQGWQGAGQNGQGDGGQGFFHHGDDMQPPSTESCGVSSLVPGAKVKDAELSVSGGGAVWEKVELVPKS
jgi:hypothetical protein